MMTASAASRAGAPATASWSPARRGGLCKVSACPSSSAAAQTDTPPSSSSRPDPTTPCAPQPTSAFAPRRSSTIASPSCTWSRFAAPAKTIARSTGAPPSSSAARPAASANASTPSSRVASPVAIRVATCPSSHGTVRSSAYARSSDAQLRLLGRRAGILAQELAEPPGRSGRVATAVVVESDVHRHRLLGHPLGALLDLLELLVGVLPSEALRDGLALQVALGIAPVHAHVGEVVARHGVDRGHDRELVAGRRVDRHEGGAVLGEPRERRVRSLAAYPVAVAKLDGHRPRGEALDERCELVELVLARRERGRQLEQQGAELAGLLGRRDRLDRRVDHRRLDLGGQLHAPARSRLGAVAQVGRQRLELG